MATTSKYWYLVGRPCGMQKKILSFLEESEQNCTLVTPNENGEYIPLAQELVDFIRSGYTPVCVLTDGPSDYYGECIWIKESPIVQVKELIGVNPSKMDNAIETYETIEDSMIGLHILVRAGYSKASLEEMTRFCREAQGITQEQENLAELAIRKSESTHGLYIVYLPHNEIATVTDRLFWQQQFPSQLIVTPQKIFYCGFDDTINDIIEFLQDDLKKDVDAISKRSLETYNLIINRDGLTTEELNLVVKQFKRLARDKFGDLM